MKRSYQSGASGVVSIIVLLVLWGIGIAEAILCGFHPDKVAVVTGAFTYPVLLVIVDCGLVCIQTAVVYAILRLFNFGGNYYRLLWVFMILCVFCCTDYFALGAGETVQRDYRDWSDIIFPVGTIVCGLFVAVWYHRELNSQVTKRL